MLIVDKSEGVEQPSVDEVHELRWWEKTVMERIMLKGVEMTRRELHAAIPDSPLGLDIQYGVDARLARSNGSVPSATALSKLGNSTALDTVKRLPKEDAYSAKRSLTDPYAIYENGGMCVEASMVAEAAMHLAYSLSKEQPAFTGYTQEVVLRSLNDDGISGHHAILKSTFCDAAGADSARFADPINGIEGSWEDFMSGREYADVSGRPTDIIGATEPVSLLWLPPTS